MLSKVALTELSVWIVWDIRLDFVLQVSSCPIIVH